MHAQSSIDISWSSLSSMKFTDDFQSLQEMVPGYQGPTNISRFHHLKKHHHERLAALNMSELLKRKLFGFSEVSFLTNQQSPADLVIQNHTIRGRKVMTVASFQERQQQQARITEISIQKFNYSQHNYKERRKIDGQSYKNQVSIERLIEEGDQNNYEIEIG